MYNPFSSPKLQTRFQEFNYLLFFLFSHDQSLEVIRLSSFQNVVIFSSRCSFVYSRPWRRSSCEPWHLERYSSVITVRWRWQLYHLVLFVFCIYSSDNLQLDLTSLGASELTRYDFGHCSIDKVFLLALFDPELSLHCLDRGDSSELHSQFGGSCRAIEQAAASVSVRCFSSFLTNSLRELVPMKVRRKLKVWLKERFVVRVSSDR